MSAASFLAPSTPESTNRMSDPPRLPPPPFWRTRYFALTVMAKADRQWIDPLDVLQVLRQPVRRDR